MDLLFCNDFSGSLVWSLFLLQYLSSRMGNLIFWKKRDLGGFVGHTNAVPSISISQLPIIYSYMKTLLVVSNFNFTDRIKSPLSLISFWIKYHRLHPLTAKPSTADIFSISTNYITCKQMLCSPNNSTNQRRYASCRRVGLFIDNTRQP